MNHYIAEGQFIPRAFYMITAESLEDAEQQFADFLDGLHGKKTKMRQKVRSVEHKRSSYILTQISNERGIAALAVWMV